MGALTLLVLVGAAGGCGDGAPVATASDDVAVATGTTPTPTREPSPTVDAGTAPARPAAMDRTDGEGAATAAQYFLSLYDYAMQSGDVSEWETFFFPTCEFCTKSMQGIAEVHAPGASLEGGGISTRLVTAYAQDTLLMGYPFDVEVTQAPAVLQSVDGSSTTVDEKTALYRVEVVHDGTTWRLVEIASL